MRVPKLIEKINLSMREIMKKLILSFAVLLIFAGFIGCSSSDSGNTNANTNDNVSGGVGAGGVPGNTNTNDNYQQPAGIPSDNSNTNNGQLKELCELMQNKLSYFCIDSPSLLTEWQEKAITDSEEFIEKCMADGFWNSLTEEQRTRRMDKINDANDCRTLVNAINSSVL